MSFEKDFTINVGETSYTINFVDQVFEGEDEEEKISEFLSDKNGALSPMFLEANDELETSRKKGNKELMALRH